MLRLDDLERVGGEAAVDEQILHELARAQWIAERPVKNLYAVGGSWRAMAKLCMLQENHPLQVLEQYGKVVSVMVSMSVKDPTATPASTLTVWPIVDPLMLPFPEMLQA